MESLIIAEIDIDGKKTAHFTDVFLSQRFNQHHEFSITLDHDVIETSGSFSMENSKNLIGKNVVIRYIESTGIVRNILYEFTGIICEVGMVQLHHRGANLMIKGYSPTILLEDGQRLTSFNDKTLKDIVTASIQNGMSKTNCLDEINPNFTNPIKYVTQYRESSFHFINRLSSDYGELFYYDGSTLIFGRPDTTEIVELMYGTDISHMQLNMHIEPMEAWKFAYASKRDAFISSRGEKLSGLSNYASHVVDVSNELFSELDSLPLMQSVETAGEADVYVTKSKEAIAAGLVVLTGTSNTAKLFLGCVAEIKTTKQFGGVTQIEDFGSYFITGITHHISSSGKYYNTFEALSNWVKGIPVFNASQPVAEPQMAWVVDNKDPDKLGRVRVKMHWQEDEEKTDWIWVMAPDAGGGKDGAAGGGFVFKPEKGDRVMVAFLFNNPDRPFVMGSLFHGKTAGAGTSRCITGRNTAVKVCIDDTKGSITITDGKSNIFLDGAGNLSIDAKTQISLTCGSSSIILPKDGQISINGTNLIIQGTEVLIHGSTKTVMKKDDSTGFAAEGTSVVMMADNAEVKGNTKAKIGGDQVKINGTTKTEVKGGTVEINP